MAVEYEEMETGKWNQNSELVHYFDQNNEGME